MNSYDRYTAVLNGEIPDFLPRTPILMQFAAEYIGSNYGEFASDYRCLVRANEICAKDLKFDQLSCISDPYRETQGFGGRVEYKKDSVPRCVPPLQYTKNFSMLSRPDPLQSERMLDRVNAVRAYQNAFRNEYSILGWIEGPAAEAADLRGVMTFFIDLMDDESFAVELMDLCVDTGIDFARAQIEAGADTIGIGDAVASQVSPDVYERLILPREKRLVNAIKGMNAFVKLHICGDITHLLPGISELDLDILDVDHMVDMAGVRKIIPGHVALAGNIDPVAGIKMSSPGKIRQEIRKIYESVGNPYLINAGCEIPAGTPSENLKAFCEPVPYVPG
jgi:MtaA/CmuA family methyltransferase